MDEQFKDWVVRYGYIFKKRNTIKRKERFLKTFISEIATIRPDVSVINYSDQDYNSKIVYVGDVSKAKKVFVTYYDTPLTHYGSYYLFDYKKQQKSTLLKLITNIILALCVGVLGIIVYILKAQDPFDLSSVITYVIIIVFALYFYFLSRVTRGLSFKSTRVRNSSSLIYMLKMLSENNADDAYVFIDNGTFGLSGLKRVVEVTNKNADIFYLDSVGANIPLRGVGPYFESQPLALNRVNHIFASYYDEDNDAYYIDQKELLAKEISTNNYENLIHLVMK